MALDPPLPGIVRSRQQAMRDADLAVSRSMRLHRVVLVPIMGDSADGAALQMAGIVGERLRARIVGLHVREPAGTMLCQAPDVVRVSSEFVARLGEAALLRAAAAHDTFMTWHRRARDTSHNTTTVAPPPHWLDIEAPVGEAIARQARIADLVVVARAPHEFSVPADVVLEGALFWSGRPVLIVPGEARADPFGTVIVAWNDSLEAAHAFSAAWPVIARARRLVIFIGTHEGDLEHSAERFVARLDWRGLAPAKVICDPSHDVGSALLATARQETAGVIVMGAYSYDRLDRPVLGDVTRCVLAYGSTPVLMAR